MDPVRWFYFVGVLIVVPGNARAHIDDVVRRLRCIHAEYVGLKHDLRGGVLFDVATYVIGIGVLQIEIWSTPRGRIVEAGAYQGAW